MTCEVEGCDRPSKKLGMCEMHYMRVRRKGTAVIIEPTPVKCIIDGCEVFTTRYNGLCLTHYKQAWYLNSVGHDGLMERTSQERWVNIATGYIMVKQDGKLTYEHRVLAEKALGKPLPPKAIVHHTQARDDNHGYCKLVICPDQEYHLLIHKRMEELGYAQD